VADRLVPYGPLGVLKPLAADIWIVEGPEIAFGVGPLKMPFPTRMTVVRLPDGAVWVHSPIEPSKETVAAVRALGPVRFLIAPNTLHYWWIADWSGLFPEAAVYLAPGLERAAKRPLPPARRLDGGGDAPWAPAIDQVLVAGGLLTEVDFFHRPSRTLILTDLIENFEPWRIRSRLLRAVVRLGGVADPDGKAPLDMRLSFLPRRKALRAAVRRMLAWEPERIVMAHGRWYAADGAAELLRAFRWVL
jgi:hypothetical protein